MDSFGNKELVGQFRIRHYLVSSLREGSGHIGYQIKKEYRGKGFASEGLRLAVIEAKKILCQYGENEIYLRCNITNPASLAVMKKNGAVIHHQDDKHYFTRIKF